MCHKSSPVVWDNEKSCRLASDVEYREMAYYHNIWVGMQFSLHHLFSSGCGKGRVRTLRHRTRKQWSGSSLSSFLFPGSCPIDVTNCCYSNWRYKRIVRFQAKVSADAEALSTAIEHRITFWLSSGRVNVFRMSVSIPYEHRERGIWSELGISAVVEQWSR